MRSATASRCTQRDLATNCWRLRLLKCSFINRLPSLEQKMRLKEHGLSVAKARSMMILVSRQEAIEVMQELARQLS